MTQSTINFKDCSHEEIEEKTLIDDQIGLETYLVCKSCKREVIDYPKPI